MGNASSAACRGLQRGWRGQGLIRTFLGGCLLLGCWTAAQGAPAVSKMLEYQPRHDVNCSMPAAAEQGSCTVELVKGKTGSGWVLKDSQGKLVRRFYSSDGRNVDSYSYYKDGVEVYREMVTPGSRVPDQFRWLNAGGSKWGVDEDRNGTIDSWKVISAEEVGQEILRALATRNIRRLEACLLSDEDIKALGLSTEMADDIRARRKTIKEKFETTITKLPKLSEKARWLHLETAAPQCLPADQTGARVDLIRHARATVLFESAGASEWFQLGQMFLVGAAWKVIDAPSPGAAIDDPDRGSKSGAIPIDHDPKLQKFVESLTDLDKKTPPATGDEAVKHHLKRADILEQIVGVVKATERDPWIRQVADSLSSAVQAGTADTTPASRLASLEKQLNSHMPGSNLTAYVTFRRMQADYSNQLGKAKDKEFSKVQQDWLDKLTGFVKSYPKAEDTPDAMLQLGMVCEFLGKEVEAKNWYSSLAKTFPDKPQGKKGAGAGQRLDLEGKPMQVVGPLLSDPSTAYDMDQLRGKIVVVYYYASWNGQAPGDFGKLKTLLDANKSDVALLCVNLDASAEEARAFLKSNPGPGTHLFQPGGLESKLATQYGVMVLPSIFLVGKDGKCLNKAGQIGTLEDEIKKHLGGKPDKKDK